MLNKHTLIFIHFDFFLSKSANKIIQVIITTLRFALCDLLQRSIIFSKSTPDSRPHINFLFHHY